jgi:hypothetical protein
MSKYEEITLVLVIGLCLAVGFAFKTVKDKEEEFKEKFGPLLDSGEKFINRESLERLDVLFRWLDDFITKNAP